ncbi:MAG: exodeoxyribonuclease VII large subunit [Aequorivita antarctica]
MSETIANRQVFSLHEVTRSIENTIEKRYQHSYWIKAEMNKLNLYQHSGHCYPDLVEKRNGKVIAQLRANLWRTDYENINKRFLEVLREPLKDGVKILFLARIHFHSTHGLSLQILDIDPSFTLGDLEQEKQETIKKLQTEGIFKQNKIQKLALVPQRIAVISVETSKGYEDFLSVLNGNPWNYRIFTFLFPSILQGDKAVTEITKQLERIKKVQDHFDAVAIIRGGGGDIGLSSFNQYVLSIAIAEFPLPVLTGIGHTANETVTEMVSYYNAITPTKLAEFLIQKFHNFSVPVKEAERKVGDMSLRLLQETKATFGNTIRLFRASTRSLVNDHKHRVRQYNLQLQQQSVFRFKNELQVLDSFNELLLRGGGQKLKEEQRSVAQLQTDLKRVSMYHVSTSKQRFSTLERDLETMHPKNVLKRGYSITTLNGRAVASISIVSVGDALETRIFDGVLISTVKSKKEISDE